MMFSTHLFQKVEGDEEREASYCTSLSIHKMCCFSTAPSFGCTQKPSNSNYSYIVTSLSSKDGTTLWKMTQCHKWPSWHEESIMSLEKQEGILHLFIGALPSQEQIRTHYGKAIQMHIFTENICVFSTNRKANAVSQPSVWNNKYTFSLLSNTFKMSLKLSYRFALITFYFWKAKKKKKSKHWTCFKELEHTVSCLTTSE